MAESAPDKVTAAELLLLPLFEGESVESVAWVASLMESRRYEIGETVFRGGDPACEFIVVLEGEIHAQRPGQGELLVFPRGRAGGVLPFSRIKTWPSAAWAAQPLRIAVMEATWLSELVRRAPLVAQRLVSEMTDRARELTRIEERSSRLLALGKLSAGLAHELNNPTAAAVRSSARLRDVLTERRRCVLELRGIDLSARTREIMNELADSISECAAAPIGMDPIERSDCESAMSDWLESAGISGDLAPQLVDAGITIEEIQPLAPLASSEVLTLGLRILTADHEILCRTREIEDASRRISDLVKAIKTYSFMDQSDISEIDVEQGVDVTLRVFQHRLKRGIQVVRRFSGNLPRIRGNGSGLNQIWTNLIDNALDAMDEISAGEPRILTIRTCTEAGDVLVEINDNGSGIPDEVERRMFDPFFTTKPVGEGTGLGLDIVRRIVTSHKGSIRVDSAPGRTVFQVRLPINRRV